MLILGIGGWRHDGAAALLRDGEIVAAIEEEKLQRQPHAGGLPATAIETCLQIAKASHDQIDFVALARPLDASSEPTFHLRLKALFPNARMVVLDHHVAHAASAFYASPYDEAQVLTVDRGGDMRCGALWHADASGLRSLRDYYSPDTPAVLYSRVAALIGFRTDAEEHKVQWLSVRGEPRFAPLFTRILGAKSGNPINLDHSYFDTARTTHGGFGEKFYEEADLDTAETLSRTERADLAASIQAATENAVIGMAGEGKNLCFAGGLGLNALLVEALEKSGKFENVWVQPAAGNAGTALGSALYAWHVSLGNKDRKPFRNLFLGPEYDSGQIKITLENCKLRFRYMLTDNEVIETAVQRLRDNQILAWFQGRTEFGPRALGNRSILASPLNPYSTINLNQFIKHREDFRKFAASVPEESAAEYFDCGQNAWSLATISRVKPAHRQTFEHALLDGDRIRVHVVSKQESPMFWQLLQTAGTKTGLPVLYNTSFNLFGEPLVSDPRSAVRSFYASGVDAMFVGSFLLEK